MKSSTRSLRSDSRSAPSRSAIETLEGRRLLSVALNSGTLTLNGTKNRDTYVVNKSGTDLTVVENGGATKKFALSSVKRISATLASGNDQLTIANVLTIPASVSGGAGDDAIITGGGNDTIDAGTGNDYIEGRDGSDTLSYASRSEKITGSIVVHYGSPPNNRPTGPRKTRQFTLDGAVGAAGEKDVSLSVEALAGGSAGDDLGVGGGLFEFDDYEDAPPVPDLRVDGNGGNDTLRAGNATESSLGLSQGFPRVRAYGGDGNDFFEITASSSRAATVNGGNGDDYFENTTDASATIEAGSGYDTFVLDARIQTTYTMPAGLEHIVVNGGADSIIGNDEANLIEGNFFFADGRGGNDTIIATSNHVTILGGSGNDTLHGTHGDDSLDGGAGSDVIDGNGGKDIIKY